MPSNTDQKAGRALGQHRGRGRGRCATRAPIRLLLALDVAAGRCVHGQDRRQGPRRHRRLTSILNGVYICPVGVDVVGRSATVRSVLVCPGRGGGGGFLLMMGARWVD
jgi:hypothetical protein